MIRRQAPWSLWRFKCYRMSLIPTGMTLSHFFFLRASLDLRSSYMGKRISVQVKRSTDRKHLDVVVGIQVALKRFAERKEHAMSFNGFQVLLGEFPQSFDHVKPLCEKIRAILFPSPQERSVVHRDPHRGSPEVLYRPIIEAFDSAI